MTDADQIPEQVYFAAARASVVLVHFPGRPAFAATVQVDVNEPAFRAAVESAYRAGLAAASSPAGCGTSRAPTKGLAVMSGDPLDRFRPCSIRCGWTQEPTEFDDEIGLRAARGQHLAGHSAYEIITALDELRAGQAAAPDGPHTWALPGEAPRPDGAEIRYGIQWTEPNGQVFVSMRASLEDARSEIAANSGHPQLLNLMVVQSWRTPWVPLTGATPVGAHDGDGRG